MMGKGGVGGCLHLNVLDQVALSHDYSSTLVAADKREFGREGPVAVHGVQVSVADTAVLDVDEDFVRACGGLSVPPHTDEDHVFFHERTWLLNIDLFELHGTACLLNHLRHLPLGNVWRHFDIEKMN